MSARLGLALALTLSSLVACSDKTDPKPDTERRGAPPPPPAASGSAAAVTCTRTEVKDDLAKAFIPGSFSDFCLDPKEPERSFGAGAPEALEKIADLYDGESKNYEDYGVNRVLHTRYVSTKGQAVSIEINASRFNTERGAYAMFTKRVVGDGDPANEDTPKATPGGGAAVLGIGNAYLWRGAWLIEIVYSDDQATPEQLDAASKSVLASYVKTVGEKIPGDDKPSSDVALLPKEALVPMGIRYRLAAAFPGLGGDVDHPKPSDVAGASGYYREGTKRWRVTVVDAADEAAAKAAFATAAKAAGASKVELGDEGTASTWKEGPLEGRVVAARKGKRIAAVWDELRVLRGGMPAVERDKLLLTSEEKEAKLKALLATL